MKLLDALRGRSSRHAARGGDTAAASADEPDLPIPGYDRLGDKEVVGLLPRLSQTELAAIETYERAHQSRPVVLDKLRYMRGSEPLPGYDALTTEQIFTALAGANAETVKAVRDYERKFQHRKSVLDETARALPGSQASAGERQAREQKAALLHEGYADRERSTRNLPGP